MNDKRKEYVRWTIRFRSEENRKLESMKREGETGRELVLRLARINAEPIARGYPSHRNYSIHNIAFISKNEKDKENNHEHM